MLEKIGEDNCLILGMVAGIYTKNLLRKLIPVQRKFSMTLLIQKEEVVMLRSSNPKELVFKVFEIEDEKAKNLSHTLPTHRDQFPLLNILNLE